jgi:hypothetical protein
MGLPHAPSISAAVAPTTEPVTAPWEKRKNSNTFMLNKLFQDKFFRHNFIFFCGSILVAFFNYLYHPILSRMMDIGSFGEVQALISLFLLLSMVIGVFRTIVINIVANAQEIKEKQEEIDNTFASKQKMFFYNNAWHGYYELTTDAEKIEYIDKLTDEEFNKLTEERKLEYLEVDAYVDEGIVTDEIRQDLLTLGWTVLDNTK